MHANTNPTRKRGLGLRASTWLLSSIGCFRTARSHVKDFGEQQPESSLARRVGAAHDRL